MASGPAAPLSAPVVTLSLDTSYDDVEVPARQERSRVVQTMVTFLRHGETDLGSRRPRVLAGQSDVPLNAAGIRQARLTAWRLRNQKFDAIVCSDQRAAKQTLDEMLPWMPQNRSAAIVYDARLREKSCSDLGGMPWTEVKQKLKAEAKTLDHYLRERADGETMAAFEGRVLDFYAEQIIEKGLLEPSGLRLTPTMSPSEPKPPLAAHGTVEAGVASPAASPTAPMTSHGSASKSDPASPQELSPTSATKEQARKALTANLHVDVAAPQQLSVGSFQSSSSWRQITSPENSSALSPDDRRALAVLPSPLKSTGTSSAPQSPSLRSIAGQRSLNQTPKLGSNASLASNRSGISKGSIRALIEDFERLSAASSPITPESASVRKNLQTPVVERVPDTVFEEAPELEAVMQEPESSVEIVPEARSVEVVRTQHDAPRRNILVIAHGGVLQLLFTHLLNDLDFDIYGEIQTGFPKHCGLYRLQLQKVVYGPPDGATDWEWLGVISLMNCVAHHALVSNESWHQWNPDAGKRKKEFLELKAAAFAPTGSSALRKAEDAQLTSSPVASSSADANDKRSKPNSAGESFRMALEKFGGIVRHLKDKRGSDKEAGLPPLKKAADIKLEITLA
ncbi:hypothetical protein DFJ74DRAFT_685107 [Hyaloraphidium curvatum]|nr:hypothetical protein DFJ74DRAFT_685107 [Hyaloraphidium curvatum]